jgi:hypothetical protein
VRFWLVALAVASLAAAARADEYAAQRFGRYDRYVKEAKQTDLSFIEGQNRPGTFVKRDRRFRWTEWHYRRGRWHLALRVRHPPDDIHNGQLVVVPLELRVIEEGDDPLTLTATAKASGIRAKERVSMVPAKLGRKARGEPLFSEPGKLELRPRLDWDDETIGISVSYGDGVGTEFEVARYRWWSNLLEEQHRVNARRDLDIRKP